MQTLILHIHKKQVYETLRALALQLGVEIASPEEETVKVQPSDFYGNFNFSSKSFTFNRDEANER